MKTAEKGLIVSDRFQAGFLLQKFHTSQLLSQLECDGEREEEEEEERGGRRIRRGGHSRQTRVDCTRLPTTRFPSWLG